ncbi:MAG TPA: hypothetical protein VN939_16785 [Chthoniobacterales bacterium]|jgi:hypothetical protein|nr:hypothetical protein [Chthoniobacterales bacterium]
MFTTLELRPNVWLVTREEIADIIRPDAFSPFVIVTGSGSRFSVDHPDFADLPPIPEEVDPDIPSFMIVYTKNGVPRFIPLENIQEIEFRPTSQ